FAACPLPDIAGQIEHSHRRRTLWEASDSGGATIELIEVCPLTMRLLITPGVHPPLSPTRGVLPLGLARQRVDIPVVQAARQPAAEGRRLVPAHPDHRVVQSSVPELFHI